MVKIFLLCLLVVAILVMVYLAVWVLPRINKISRVQRKIIRLVYNDHQRWPYKQHMCNRESGALEYTFQPISMRTFLSDEEIEELYTIDGVRVSDRSGILPERSEGRYSVERDG